MSLKERVNQKSKAAQSPGPKRNPEIDAKIDLYIEKHPERINYLMKESKENLVRRAVLKDALKYHSNTQRRTQENEAVNKFLKENPAIAGEIEKRIANVPADRKEQVRLKFGREAATKTALKMS